MFAALSAIVCQARLLVPSSQCLHALGALEKVSSLEKGHLRGSSFQIESRSFYNSRPQGKTKLALRDS
eukprot:6176134-Pleurochrysis_carterae.AAC.2